MNMWGWTIAAMTPEGWRRVVQGKTWPAHRPTHQIDHILVTPSVEVVGRRACCPTSAPTTAPCGPGCVVP